MMIAEHELVSNDTRDIIEGARFQLPLRTEGLKNLFDFVSLLFL